MFRKLKLPALIILSHLHVGKGNIGNSINLHVNFHQLHFSSALHHVWLVLMEEIKLTATDVVTDVMNINQLC